MLTTLRKFDRQTRSGILADYAQGLLPRPGINEQQDQGLLSEELRQRLNEEIVRELNLRSLDTPEARNKILQFLSRQITETVIETKKIKEIRDRVGRAGSLPIEQYDITFADSTRSDFDSLGIDRSLVRSSINSAETIEHMLPEKFGMDSEKATTLITKTYRSGDSYTLLVLATREKAKLRVDHVWYVFHSDVDLSSAKSPTDVLKMFVEKFGFEIKVGGVRAKFIAYEVLPPFYGNPREIMRISENIGNLPYKSILYVRPTLDKLEVAYAFAIDMSAYKKSLQNHGIGTGLT